MPMLSRIRGPEDLKSLSHEQLTELAKDCRQLIVETITKTGGHLASNLGVVELTLALHRAFDSPKDRLVWDTSNQCYTHKLVTGRWQQFRRSGRRGASRASPSRRKATTTPRRGARGDGPLVRDGDGGRGPGRAGRPVHGRHRRRRLAHLGDSYEALNNIVHVKPKRLIIVLNDNGWSISESVGWLAHWRNRFELHPTYQKFVGAGHKFFKRLPKGEEAWGLAKKIKNSVEGLFFPNRVWDELGYYYVGPIDGHDYKELEEAFSRAREVSRDGTPVVIHALTHKGRGFDQAEDNPTRFHQPGTPFPAAGGGTRYTYSQVFAKTMTSLMERDPKIVAISAAMLEGTALSEVKKKFPDRVFDVGIAEGHAVIMAGGMAKAGLRPVVAIYSTFLQRSYDQLIHDVCLQNLPRDGLRRPGGIRRRRREDAPGDLRRRLHARHPEHDGRGAEGRERAPAPALHRDLLRPAVRRSGTRAAWGSAFALDETLKEIPVGRGEILSLGKSINLLAYGSMVPVALEAAEALRGQRASTRASRTRGSPSRSTWRS